MNLWELWNGYLSWTKCYAEEYTVGFWWFPSFGELLVPVNKPFYFEGWTKITSAPAALNLNRRP